MFRSQPVSPIFSFFSPKCSGFLIALMALAFSAVASASPTLSRISCTSSTFSTASSDACSVYLSATTNNKLRVTLSSSNPAVVVPNAVTVRAGAASAGFTANVAAVSTAQSATITAQAGGVATTFGITLSPSGGTPALKVSGSSISFGSVAQNTTVSQPLTLSSTGTSAVTVNSISVSGTGFSISAVTLPAVLNPGQSLTLSVQFDPTTASSFTGQLTINSNAAANPTVAVSLSGTGTAHQVDLSWSAPTSSSVAVSGYKVYREAAGATSFTVVDAMDTQTSYTDSNLQSGQTYNYYVTSVDSSGVESAPSNTTTVTVP